MRSVFVMCVLGVVLVARTSGAAPEPQKAGPRVDAANGTFSSSVTLDVPAFRGGLEPRLALTYDSAAGVGVAGVGWGLQASSQIERRSQNGGAPRWDSTDVYFLDGQELVGGCTTFGGTHCTKRQSYLRIAYNVGSNNWTVTERNGNQSSYAEVVYSERGTVRWGIAAMRDAYTAANPGIGQNVINYAYWCDVPAPPVQAPHECYLDTITYGSAEVRFYRETRPDPIVTARGTSTVAIMNYRLKSVVMRVGGSLLRAYGLTYTTSTSSGRSLVQQVMLFGRDASVDGAGTPSGGTQRLLQQSTWGHAAPSYGSPSLVLTALSTANGFGNSGSDDNFRTIDYGDVTGDGKLDVCYRTDSSGYRCAPGVGNGLFGTPFVAVASNTNNGVSASLGGNNDWDNYPSMRLTDVSGDGKADLCWRGDSGMRCAISYGTSFGTPYWAGTSAHSLGEYRTIAYVDLNNDAKSDLCWRQSSGYYCAYSNGSTFGSSFLVTSYLANGPTPAGNIDDDNQLTITHPDVNGDRRADVCFRGDSFYWCALQLPSGSFATPVSSVSNVATNLSASLGGNNDGDNYPTISNPDINGDGMADVCWRGDNGYWCGLSRGDGSFTTAQNVLTNLATNAATNVGGNGGAGNWDTIQNPDINADGRQDVCWRGDNGWWCATSRGDGTFNTASNRLANLADSTGLPGGNNDWDNYPTIRVSDVTTDGLADLCWRGDSGLYCTAASVGRDLLISSQNDLGGVTSVVYASSSEFSHVQSPPPMMVVKEIREDDGRGQVALSAYTYQDGLYDVIEGRFLGFRYVRHYLPCANGEPSCAYEETWYRQDYASFGLPDATARLRGDGTYQTYSVFTYQINGSTPPYTALETQRQDYFYDQNATAWKLHGVSRSYDAYGQVVAEARDGDTSVSADDRYTQTTFSTNTSAYIVSAPQRTLVFAGLSPAGTLKRDTYFSYDGAGSWATPPTYGRLTRTEAWDSATGSYVASTQTHDATTGLVVTTTRPSALGNLTTTMAYDASQRFVTTTTLPGGAVALGQTEPVCGVATLATDVGGRSITTTLDALCRPIYNAASGGGYESITYANTGSPTTQYIERAVPGPSGDVWIREYADGMGRIWRKERRGPSAGVTVREDTWFDGRGNAAVVSRPYYSNQNPVWKTIEFDARERPVRQTNPDSTIITFDYGVSTVTLTDELGQQQVRTLDSADHVVAHTDYASGVPQTATYTYDIFGKMTQSLSPDGSTATMTYGTLGQLTSKSESNSGTWSYTYDGSGNRMSEVDGRGLTTTYVYDASSRMTQKTNADGVVTWTYDEFRGGAYSNGGRLTTVSDPSGTARIDYTTSGETARLERTVTGSGTYTFTHSYDLGGRLLDTSYPDGTTSGALSYDEAGQLASIARLNIGLTYAADGQLATITSGTLGTTLVTTRSTNARGWLTGISTVKNGSTTVQSVTYGFDAKGRATSRTDGVSAADSFTYAYDSLDQVTSAVSAATGTQTWTYAAGGNTTANSRVGSYAYDAVKQQQLVAAGSYGFAYDANGNMTSGAGRTLTWNASNLLAQVNGATMTYDAHGRRVTRTVGGITTITLGDEYEISGGVHTKYYTAGGVLVGKTVGTTNYWMHTDRLGSVEVITDASGNEVMRNKYRVDLDRYATSGTHVETRLGTGMRLDAAAGLSGLYALGARYYDPLLGRFISPDPTQPSGRVIGLNRYAYASNNSVNVTDIDGYGFDWKMFWNLVVVNTFRKIVTGGLTTDIRRYGLGKALLLYAIDVAAAVITAATMGAGTPLAVSAQIALTAAVAFTQTFAKTLIRGGSLRQAIRGGLINAALAAFTKAVSLELNEAKSVFPGQGAQKFFDVVRRVDAWLKVALGKVFYVVGLILSLGSKKVGNYLRGFGPGVEFFMEYGADQILGYAYEPPPPPTPSPTKDRFGIRRHEYPEVPLGKFGSDGQGS